MNSSNSIYTGTVVNIAKKAPQLANKQTRKSTLIEIFFFLILILIFVGDEAVKVAFRKNFFINKISFTKIIICISLFGYISYLSLTGTDFNFGVDSENSSSILFITGILYLALSLYILIKTILIMIKSNPDPDYLGDSSLLSFLKDYGWSELKIRYLGEPLYTLIIGGFLFLYSELAGIPIIICGVSVWIHALMQLMIPNSLLRRELDQTKQLTNSNEIITNQVNAD